MDHRIPGMVSKDTDIVVVHLGTNDALNASTDGRCIVHADTALNNIELVHRDTHPSVPLLLCTLPPHRKENKGQRLVEMLNHLFRRRCSGNSHLHFVETGLSLEDLDNDGVHLLKPGKAKLAKAILTASRDFTRAKHVMNP